MTDYKKILIKEGIVIFVVIVITVSFGVLIGKNIVHQGSILGTLRQQKSLMTNSAENLGLLKKDWEIASKYLGSVQSLVPHKDDLVLLSKNFQTLASATNVTLTFSFGTEKNPVSAKDLGYIGFSANVDGTKDNVVEFMRRLEEKYYAIKIEVVDFQSPTAGIVRAFLRGQIYFATN